MLLSCNNSDITKGANNKATENQRSDTSSTKTQRQLLIEELKRLQAVFASKDKNRITDVFPFPLSDSSVSIYIDDSAFDHQYKKNGNMVTKAMFVRFYKPISESLQIDQVKQLFKNLKVDDLQIKDTLEYNAIIKTEPCYHFYGIGIEDNLVTLTLGTNSNENYESKSMSEDETPENSSEFCEHVLWWVFRFDGKKLHLVKIHGAG
jgi:hypothetical protein